MPRQNPSDASFAADENPKRYFLLECGIDEVNGDSSFGAIMLNPDFVPQQIDVDNTAVNAFIALPANVDQFVVSVMRQ